MYTSILINTILKIMVMEGVKKVDVADIGKNRNSLMVKCKKIKILLKT